MIERAQNLSNKWVSIFLVPCLGALTYRFEAFIDCLEAFIDLQRK